MFWFVEIDGDDMFFWSVECCLKVEGVFDVVDEVVECVLVVE